MDEIATFNNTIDELEGSLRSRVCSNFREAEQNFHDIIFMEDKHSCWNFIEKALFHRVAESGFALKDYLILLCMLSWDCGKYKVMEKLIGMRRSYSVVEDETIEPQMNMEEFDFSKQMEWIKSFHVQKAKGYGGSWCRYGWESIFQNLARKVDRIRNLGVGNRSACEYIETIYETYLDLFIYLIKAINYLDKYGVPWTEGKVIREKF